jgi:hypothetical protein
MGRHLIHMIMVQMVVLVEVQVQGLNQEHQLTDKEIAVGLVFNILAEVVGVQVLLVIKMGLLRVVMGFNQVFQERLLIMQVVAVEGNV